MAGPCSLVGVLPQSEIQQVFPRPYRDESDKRCGGPVDPKAWYRVLGLVGDLKAYRSALRE